MPVSPELTGGAGFTFEDGVVAFYLTSLLVEGGARGLRESVVSRVSVQRGGLDEPLDDIIVDGEDRGGHLARLRLQVKRSLSFSAAPSNSDLAEIVARSWSTLTGREFRDSADRVGAATHTLDIEAARHVRTTCEWARDSANAEDFLARVDRKGLASAEKRSFVNLIRSLLEGPIGRAPMDDELWHFIRHFVLLEFDVLGEGAGDEDVAVERLRTALRPDEANRAFDLWIRLRIVAREAAGAAGSFDRAALLGRIGSGFTFEAARSFRHDIQRIGIETGLALSSIGQAIDGATVPRHSLVDQIQAHLRRHRFVQLRGGPGSGKSAVLRAAAELHQGMSPIVVLKSDRLFPGGWPGFAERHRLGAASPEQLLLELGSASDPVLFIDGIDRIEKAHRSVVLDFVDVILRNPALGRWRVLVTVRDSQTEHLRTWLPAVLTEGDGVGVVDVKPFSNQEAAEIAQIRPYLRNVLFGPPPVREVARRPFFLAVLARSLPDRSDAAPPASEAELLQVWWQRGGYDSEGGEGGRRQEVLLDLALRGARGLGRHIMIRGLDRDAVASLIADGIVRPDEPGHTVSFQHDIFFEWAFVHRLIDASSEEEGWLSAVVQAGEAPALGRPVELLAQLRFERETGWAGELAKLEAFTARSQWNRSWLIGPVYSPLFAERADEFAATLLGVKAERLGKLLVWFQATRTDANPNILGNTEVGKDLSTFERLRIADALGWPADYPAWGRLCSWLASHGSEIPIRLWSDALSIAEVWQNALSAVKNPVSEALLDLATKWLHEIENHRHSEDTRFIPGSFGNLDSEDLTNLEGRLRLLLLRSCSAAPERAAAYLDRVVERPRLRGEIWDEVRATSPVLAKVQPTKLVEAFLAEALEPLPRESVRLKRESWDRQVEASKSAPEGKRRRMSLPLGLNLGVDRWDWDHLSLDRFSQAFYPASPVQEPFPSLFVWAPAEALRLVRTLSNHAVAAWRELHELDRERGATPVPVEIDFSWGLETFWGTYREYIAFRGAFAPHVLESALMALEDWAFKGVEQGRDVDEVIRDVVSGNHHPAVLGIASAIFVETRRLTPTTLALATCQRLWHWDLRRSIDIDRGNMFSNEIGARDGRHGGNHLEALQRANRRPGRSVELRSVATLFALCDDAGLRDAFSSAVARFPENLRFEFEEQKGDPETVAEMTESALHWAEVGRIENYTATEVEGGVQIAFENPRAAEPRAREVVDRYNQMSRWLELALWVRATLDREGAPPPFTLAEAVVRARELDEADLFARRLGTGDLEDARRAGVAGVAAALLDSEGDPGSEELEWAVDVTARALQTPEPADGLTVPDAVVMFHPCVYAARALGAMVRKGLDPDEARQALLELMLHPLHAVSTAALNVTQSVRDIDPRFAWIAFGLGIDLSIRADPLRPLPPGYSEHGRTNERMRMEALERAWQSLSDSSTALPPVPTVPEAWVHAPLPPTGDPDWDGVGTSEPVWRDPDRHLNVGLLVEVLKGPDLDWLLSDSERRTELLQLCDGLLRWTISKHLPQAPDHKPDKHWSDLWKWRAGFLGWLGMISVRLVPADAQSRFLIPLLALPDEPCFELLAPFVSHYLCGAVLDALEIDPGCLDLARAAAGRLGNRQRSYRGDLDEDAMALVRSLLFTEITGAAGSKRFANGVWTEVATVLPLVDAVLARVGHIPAVTQGWLTLVERAANFYPGHAFVDQARRIFESEQRREFAWRGTSIPARLAGLIQHFADRDTPLPASLAHDMLRLLDALIDEGDRRAAALQTSEAFRSIQVG